MKKHFKPALIVLALSIAIAVVPSGAYAEATAKSYTDAQINSVLLSHGMPADKISSLDANLKRTIVENAVDPNFNYQFSDSTNFHRDDNTGNLIENAPTVPGQFQTQSISRSDLVFNVIAFSTSVANEYQIYGNYEWLTTGAGPSSAPTGPYKDVFAITVPDGWQIESGSSKYGAAMYKNWYNFATGGFSGWVSDGTNGFENSGQPASDGYSLYGAAWRMNSTTNNIAYYYKGTTWLTMKGTASSQKRVLVAYMESKENPLTGFAATLGWGPLQVSYYAQNGSVNTANQDYSW